MKNKNFEKSPCIHKVKKTNIKIKKLLNKVLIFSIAFCGVFFVVCVNDIAIKGFVIKDLKTRVFELNEESKAIELRAHELKSLEGISARAAKMKMVKVDKIDYITVIDGAVALRD